MLNKIISERKSIVCFDSRPIEKEKLRSLFEAARWAPSSRNYQPWRFIAGQKNNPAFDRIISSLDPTNKIWAGYAPLLIVSVAQMVFAPDNRPNKHAWHDTGMAYSNLVFQAVSLGLMAHPMAGFSSEVIKKEFAIPSNFEPVIVSAIGYSGDCSGMPAELEERSKKPRVRKPVEEFVFSNGWDELFFERND